MEITKGNWEVSDSGFVRYSTFGRTTTGARKFVVNADIGIIAEAQGDTQEEADANANLIAAAPAQNAALERAREDINWMLNNRKFLNPEVFDYIDEALLGAEGR